MWPPAVTVAPGDTFTAYIVIEPPDASFNGFDASVRFDPSALSYDAMPLADQRGPLMTSACANTFHRFDAAPDSLKITLTLLCSNTNVAGPGTIYRVRFRAGTTTGATTLSLGPFTEFYRAGLFVRPIHKQDMTVNVGSMAVGDDPGPGGRLEFASPAPNPAWGRRSVLLEFNLPAPDIVSLEVLDAQGRRVAGRSGEWYAAGRHQVPWSPPALACGAYFVRIRTLASGSVVRGWAVLR
jgi:hypothetical protein